MQLHTEDANWAKKIFGYQVILSPIYLSLSQHDKTLAALVSKNPIIASDVIQEKNSLLAGLFGKKYTNTIAEDDLIKILINTSSLYNDENFISAAINKERLPEPSFDNLIILINLAKDDSSKNRESLIWKYLNQLDISTNDRLSLLVLFRNDEETLKHLIFLEGKIRPELNTEKFFEYLHQTINPEMQNIILRNTTAKFASKFRDYQKNHPLPAEAKFDSTVDILSHTGNIDPNISPAESGAPNAVIHKPAAAAAAAAAAGPSNESALSPTKKK